MTDDKDALLPCPFHTTLVGVKFQCTEGYGHSGPHTFHNEAPDFARITAALAEKDDGRCQWSPDADFELGDTWHGECGAVWTFTDGGPAENNMKFCPHCGKSVSLPLLPKGE